MQAPEALGVGSSTASTRPLQWLVDRAARGLHGLAERAGTSFELAWPNGQRTHCGDGAPAFVCRLHTRGAVRALLLRNELRLGEAYLDGEIDIDGDLLAMLGLRRFLGDLSPLDHLRQTYLQPLLKGRVRQDERLIESHYDESPDFYLRFLDRRHRCYSHGFFASEDEPLDDAIGRKLRYALDALQLPRGSRILDIGAGWGAMTEFGARSGYEIVSLTLSTPSQQFVQGLIDAQNLSAKVEQCHLYAYQDPRPFDGIVNLGVTEHLPDYEQTLAAYARLLKPGGRVYLDACSTRVKHSFSAFVKRYIYPGDATPLALHDYARAVARSPFELMSLADDRDSYRLTTLAWARNLEASRDEIIERWGERQYRRFRIYLWGCVSGFQRHEIGAYHWVLRKLEGADRSLWRRNWVRRAF